MNEDEIKLGTRLMMLENLISTLYADKLRGVSCEDFKSFRESVLLKAREETFPGIDPAMSDHIAAEYEANVESFLSGVKEKLGLR